MDRTIRVWDAIRGKLTHTIEVHSNETRGIAFSPDGRVLVSHSWDDTLRFWRGDNPRQLAVVKFNHLGAQIYNRVAFAPDGRQVGAVRGNEILIFEIDLGSMILGEADVESVRYTTAKLVLVGDSGVGKTGLGWRLSHGEFKEHASTHGQQFWVVDSLRTTRADRTECEAVLWDLAGQHVYRPVHAIFLEKVDLALMVFDPTNRQESLKGVEFWLDQLAGKSQLPPTVLVGARLDRGSPVLSREELEQFCQRRGISGGYVGTSAKGGEGIDTLIGALNRLIPWEDASATVTTSTFKRIKDYVFALKETPERKGVLISPTQLRERLTATYPYWKVTEDEMMTAISHLENHGCVSVLKSSAGQRFVLLSPALLPDLASSIFLQADKHPRELGAISETVLLRGGYPFPELTDLEPSEKETLVDSTVTGHALSPRDSHIISWRVSQFGYGLRRYPAGTKQPENLERPSGGLRV
jgi:small GTP-binding protein